jgi:hypothetical protein
VPGASVTLIGTKHDLALNGTGGKVSLAELGKKAESRKYKCRKTSAFTKEGIEDLKRLLWEAGSTLAEMQQETMGRKCNRLLDDLPDKSNCCS